MTTNSIRRISQARFGALSLSKHPIIAVIATESEWYSDAAENVLGALLLDHTDNDWNYVVLGRDERGIFRYIDGEVCFESRDAARARLHLKIEEYATRGDVVFPQEDATRKKNEIFRQIVSDAQLHPFFARLRDHDGHSASKGSIQEIAYSFVDLDGNFIQQFQSDGFNSRLWELFIFAFLHEEGFIIGDKTAYPDYECIKGGTPIYIECVTVNASPGFDIDWQPSTPTQLAMLHKDYLPIKFGSSLFSKLGRKYWLEPHLIGKSLILAIHDFHKDDSMVWSAAALPPYLYGKRWRAIFDASGRLDTVAETITSHTWKHKTIPSGFFCQPESENVAAVLFCNSATLAKFDRMGKLAGFGNPKLRLLRSGICHNHDPNATDPLPFSVEVASDKYSETWGQGVAMFHNPNALHPVDPNLFPHIAHHHLQGDRLRSVIPEFFPLASKTVVLVPR